MRPRSMLAAAVISLGLALAADASATQELREPTSHFVIDVHDSWKIYNEADYVVAAPKDESFHLRLKGTTGGRRSEAQAEQELFAFLRRHLDNITKTETKAISQNNYVGTEFIGKGFEHDGTPAKWFTAILVDSRNASKGLVIVGTGTVQGFDQHSPGIHTALASIRTY
jgi:hypothetical protein